MISSKNKIKKVLFLLLICIIPTYNVFADNDIVQGSADFGYSPPGPGSSDTSGNNSGTGTGCGGSVQPGCAGSINININTSAHFDIYDLTTSDTPTLIGSAYNPNTLKNKKFIAGTYIGIDAYEEYKVVIKITGIKGIEGYSRGYIQNGNCHISFSPFYSGNNLSSLVGIPYKGDKNEDIQTKITFYDDTEKTILRQILQVEDIVVGGDDKVSPSTPYVPQCECGTTILAAPSQRTCIDRKIAEALNYLNIVDNKIESMYTAKSRKDVNEIKNEEMDKVEDKREPEKPKPVYDPKLKENMDDVSDITITYTLRVKYNLPPACINVKTGIVSYREDGCKENELAVQKKYTQDVSSMEDSEKELYRIGQYFIPLNAKSTDTYTYILEGNRKEPKELCESYIDNSKDMTLVRNTIMYVDDKTGEKKEFSEDVKSKDKAKTLVEDGCYLSTTATFKINQEFYNQTTSNNIEGYGVYFRPIDINNPFPNGLSKNSYWTNFYNKETKKIENVKDAIGNNIDITKSFNSNELSYKIYLTNNKIKNIKKYNNNKTSSGGIYTSWKSMDKNGTSQFITTERFDILNRISKNKKYSFYKLGCGPANANWEECK